MFPLDGEMDVEVVLQLRNIIKPYEPMVHVELKLEVGVSVYRVGALLTQTEMSIVMIASMSNSIVTRH